MSATRTPVPLSFFGIPVGLLAFANTWHVGARLWHLPSDVACARWRCWARARAPALPDEAVAPAA